MIQIWFRQVLFNAKIRKTKITYNITLEEIEPYYLYNEDEFTGNSVKMFCSLSIQVFNTEKNEHVIICFLLCSPVPAFSNGFVDILCFLNTNIIIGQGSYWHETMVSVFP